MCLFFPNNSSHLLGKHQNHTGQLGIKTNKKGCPHHQQETDANLQANHQDIVTNGHLSCVHIAVFQRRTRITLKKVQDPSVYPAGRESLYFQ